MNIEACPFTCDCTMCSRVRFALTSERADDAIHDGNDPLLDGTDFAHPAWFRGVDAAIGEVTKALGLILDGKKHGGVFGDPRLQAIHVRVKELLEIEARMKGLEK